MTMTLWKKNLAIFTVLFAAQIASAELPSCIAGEKILHREKVAECSTVLDSNLGGAKYTWTAFNAVLYKDTMAYYPCQGAQITQVKFDVEQKEYRGFAWDGPLPGPDIGQMLIESFVPADSVETETSISTLSIGTGDKTVKKKAYYDKQSQVLELLQTERKFLFPVVTSHIRLQCH